MNNSAVKVLLQDDDKVETLWADRVGPDLYRLDNLPFWAYGVSWRDVVEAHPDPNGVLRMTRVVEKSGHRTVRVVFSADSGESAKAQAILAGVKELGASYEGMNPRYVAIDIPPGVELATVTGYLTERGAQWEYADPRYSEVHPDNAADTPREAAG